MALIKNNARVAAEIAVKLSEEGDSNKGNRSAAETTTTPDNIPVKLSRR